MLTKYYIESKTRRGENLAGWFAGVKTGTPKNHKYGILWSRPPEYGKKSELEGLMKDVLST